ncbi:MAG TPA: OsmC family protein [Candidatus Nanopelagicaceae bacterium]
MNVVVETITKGVLEITAGKATTRVDRTGDPDATGFHSVDLLLAGLGSCMVGTMLSAADEASIPVGHVRVELRPIVSFGPERVSKIKIKMFVGGEITADQTEELKLAAESCKVHNSLHSGVLTELDFNVEPKWETA